MSTHPSGKQIFGAFLNIDHPVWSLWQLSPVPDLGSALIPGDYSGLSALGCTAIHFCGGTRRKNRWLGRITPEQALLAAGGSIYRREYCRREYNARTVHRSTVMILKNKITQTVGALRDMLYGATIYEMVRDLNKERSHLDHLFILIVFGDFWASRFYPLITRCACCPTWCQTSRVGNAACCAERDLTDLCDQEIT